MILPVGNSPLFGDGGTVSLYVTQGWCTVWLALYTGLCGMVSDRSMGS
jgi:hypothetical protein